MSTYRMFTVAFKRQIAQEFLAGASLNALSHKHEVARNLIRIWVAKYQAGEFEPDFVPMPRLSAHEIKIAELERMVGKLTMELEFLRGSCEAHHCSEARSHRSSPAPRPLRQARMRAHEPRSLDVLQPANGAAAEGRADHREDRRDLR